MKKIKHTKSYVRVHLKMLSTTQTICVRNVAKHTAAVSLYTLLENLTDDAIALLCAKKISIISLYLTKTLRHIELSNSVISQTHT